MPVQGEVPVEERREPVEHRLLLDSVTSSAKKRAIPSSAVKKDWRDGDEDERPPICPACGVTMGIREDRTSTRFVCLECGFAGGAGSGS